MAVVTFFYCLFVFGGYRQLFRDADAGWQILTGERILSNGVVPQQDPYSFSRDGAPWFAWEWAGDVVAGLLHQSGGLRAVALWYASVIAATVWLWLRLHWALHADFLLACVSLPLLLSTTSLHWLARPHVLSWPFLLAALWTAERAPESLRPLHLLAVACGSMVWTNLHPSFFFGPLIGLLYAFGYWAGPHVFRTAPHEGGRVRWLLVAALTSAAASLANPYFWRLHLHVFSYLTDSELLAHVAEFQSFNFHVHGAFAVQLTIMLSFVGVIFALMEGNLGRFFFSALLTALALRSARALPLAALLLLPLANASLVSASRRWDRLTAAAHAALDVFWRYSGNLRSIDSRYRGWLLAPACLAVAYGILGTRALANQTGFPPEEFPVAAAARIEPLDNSARILSSDKFGGYLIYRFKGERKVWVDGRSDFYGSAFMKDYLLLMEARPGWREILREGRFTHALLASDSALCDALRSAGWHTLYSDKVAVLLAADRQ
jgi:hypothetical protein